MFKYKFKNKAMTEKYITVVDVSSDEPELCVISLVKVTNGKQNILEHEIFTTTAPYEIKKAYLKKVEDLADYWNSKL